MRADHVQVVGLLNPHDAVNDEFGSQVCAWYQSLPPPPPQGEVPFGRLTMHSKLCHDNANGGAPKTLENPKPRIQAPDFLQGNPTTLGPIVVVVA